MVGFQRPRMPGIEIGEAPGRRQPRHQAGIGQAGSRIVLGEPRNCAGLLDSRVQAVLAQVGRAGAALALAEIHGDRDAAIVC